MLLNRGIPTAVDDAYTHYGSDTKLAPTADIGVLLNDTDPAGDPLTATLVDSPIHGSMTLDPDGSFRYQPNEDFVGQDAFTYTASDGTEDSNTATVAITVGAGCSGIQATITGTAGRDTLTGTAGPNVIAGLGRGDVIRAGGGDDTVCGGAGNDTAAGAAGNDQLYGGSRNDRLYGDGRIDGVFGGAGDDLLAGGAASPDSCGGEEGTDALLPNHGCEQISGIP